MQEFPSLIPRTELEFVCLCVAGEDRHRNSSQYDYMARLFQKQGRPEKQHKEITDTPRKRNTSIYPTSPRETLKLLTGLDCARWEPEAPSQDQ